VSVKSIFGFDFECFSGQYQVVYFTETGRRRQISGQDIYGYRYWYDIFAGESASTYLVTFPGLVQTLMVGELVVVMAQV
jgi:hypothetical protein